MSTLRIACLTMALLGLSASAQAQYVVLSPAPVFVATPPPPVVFRPAPIVNYSFYQPATSYYLPVAPAPAPTVVFSAPVVAPAPTGVITTRTYTGFGIFRPRGTFTESFYTPFVR